MARVPQITQKEQLPTNKQPIFEDIAGSRGHVRGPFSVLLHSPDIAGRVAHLGAYIRFDSILPGPLRELMICTAAREYDCPFVWADHVPLARQEGISDATLQVIAQRAPLESLPPEEALVVRYGRELVRNHRVSQPTFQATQERFGVQGITELTAVVGYYSLLACALNAFEVTPDPGTPQLP